MKISMQVVYGSFEYPARSEPAWGSEVERWSQLDAPAFGLAQVYHQFQKELAPLPSMLILASPRGSNATDRQFAEEGAKSPSRFVHTLQNIRSAALVKLMGWNGPVLCLQKDPCTISHALHEAAEWCSLYGKPVWVASYAETERGPLALFCKLNPLAEIAKYHIANTGVSIQPWPDKDLLGWLTGNSKGERFSLAEPWEIVNSGAFGGI